MRKEKYFLLWTISEPIKANWSRLGLRIIKTVLSCFLPPYSPEINPDEYVNRALKTDIRSRAPAKIESLKKRTQRFMSKMANSARKILTIFEIEQVRYAAAIC